MTLPTSQIPITAGAGTVTAAELLSSKYYGTPILAGPKGHLEGSRASYVLIIPPVSGTVAAANKVHFDLFNASASGFELDVHGIFAMPPLDTGIAQALGIRFDLFRTTAIGTGGTTVGNDSTTAINTFTALDPADGVRPAGITCRVAPTGGATTGSWIGQCYLVTEEVNTSHSYHNQWQNLIRYEQMDDLRNLRVPENAGIKLVQGPVVIGTPNLSFRVVFSVYAP